LETRAFSEILILWYHTKKRDLPWRKIKDPYKIWLSEVILQQTRVAQGSPYYEKFVQHYPTVKALANADEQEVLRLWQGLGYYSRARNMYTTAKIVVNDFDGIFPSNYEDLLKLKVLALILRRRLPHLLLMKRWRWLMGMFLEFWLEFLA